MASSKGNIGYKLHVYKSLLKTKNKKKASSTRMWIESKIELTKALLARCNKDAELRKENFEEIRKTFEYSRNLRKSL
jgi:hypothetical protein